ncbi:hypothetical protein EB74_30010 [Mycobacterium sp. SWH-M5]|nr:hypothetical protein EB74_30010 [Mycobacterium sp. SWH-M5]
MTVEAPSSPEDFELLPMWYELAGVETEPGEAVGAVERFQKAFEAGYLGAASGKSFRGNLKTLVSLPPGIQWYFARMAVRVLRLNGEPIGMLVMGSHQRLWNKLHDLMSGDEALEQIGEFAPSFQNFVVGALLTAKVHVVAVHPDHQGRGHGSRLLRQAHQIAGLDGLKMVYGQFETRRSGLRKFYSENGFKVLDAGAPLRIELVTGRRGEKIGGLPTETFFVWEASG